VPSIPDGSVRKSSGTWYEKYAYTIDVPSVQWAAVRTIVGDRSVPEQRCMYSPSASWKARSPTNGYRLSSSGKPSVIASAEVGNSSNADVATIAARSFFNVPPPGGRVTAAHRARYYRNPGGSRRIGKRGVTYSRRLPEGKTVKNRVHLDLQPQGIAGTTKSNG
jgi:hypothetical protein